jgi:methylmalonyl-CoA mutase
LRRISKEISVFDVSLHQNAGASIIQQLAYSLSKTKELTEIFGGDVFSKLIFRIAIGGNYFFEIAKIRALKLLFNQFSKEFGLDEIPYVFAETSFRNKSKNDVENNLIRSSLELSAAMIGGADAVFSNDYTIDDSTSLSAEISFQQQIVLAYESIINVFDDAGNGSYYVEDLTRQLAEKSWQLFLEIEEEGGYCELFKQGKIQEKIYEQAVKEQSWVEEGKIKLIGVNQYPKLDRTRTVEVLYARSEVKAVRLSEMFE